MDLNNILLWAHSLARWVVIVATLVALIVLILRLIQNGGYDLGVGRVMRFFSISVAIQWVIGLVLFVVMGAFDIRYRWEHVATMTLVLIVAHVHYMVKRRPERTRLVIALVSILVVLALVYVGVALLPQGWRVLPPA